MTEFLLYCEICTNREPPIGVFDLEDLVFPITGAIFRSPDPAHEVPPPFDPSADWRACVCRRCKKRAFIDEDRVLTNVGYVEVKRVLPDVSPSEPEPISLSDSLPAEPGDIVDATEPPADVREIETSAETTEEPTTTAEAFTGSKRTILKMLGDGVPYREILAVTMGRSKSYLTKLRQKFVEDGFLSEEGRLTREGDALVKGSEHQNSVNESTKGVR